jgi:hypothetical protein
LAKKVRYDDYPERDELRRRSYTDFSSRFPGETAKPRGTKEEREKRHNLTLTALAVVGCLGIVFIGFFVTTVLLAVSRQDPAKITDAPDISGTIAPTVSATQNPAEAALDKIRAMTATEAALGGGSALEKFLKDTKAANCDTAVFVLKTAEGSVLYPSALEQAKKGDILKKNYAAAKDSVAAAHKAGLHVIVRISCFRDSTAPSVLPDAAVRYSQDTRMLWLDDYPDKGGKPWLNPFSNEARDYLLAIIREAVAMKPDAVYLTGVQFPNGAQALATFPGENNANSPTRNVQLIQFIKDAKNAMGKLPLLCEMDAQAALQTAGAAIYGGDLWSAAADALVIPVSGEAEAKLLQNVTHGGNRRWLPQMKEVAGGGTEYETFIIS